MNDYKMEVFQGSKSKKEGTRCYDLEKVLQLGRGLFKTNRKITRIIFTVEKRNDKVTLKRNLLRTKYQDIKIRILFRAKY